MSKEIRSLAEDQAEVRIKPDSRQVEGYGIVFNKWSVDLGGFRERIAPQAVDGVIEQSDILALMNHDKSRGILARSIQGKGSMTLAADKKGVKYSFVAPTFDLGQQLVEGIQRGDISASSFAFSVAEGGDIWERGKDGLAERTILKFNRLFDMSPCTQEAYKDTTVALRSLEDFTTQADPEPDPPPAETGTREAAPARLTSRTDRILQQLNHVRKLKNQLKK